MPELPEVETVVRELAPEIKGSKVVRISVLQPKLRKTIPDLSFLHGEKILSVKRRAKYILIQFQTGNLISHLGMTGKWVWRNPEEEQKHDHVKIDIETERGLRKTLVYNDVRRFGLLFWEPQGKEGEWRKALGPEPLEKWNVEDLIKVLSKTKTAIKKAIMDNRTVVGVGNIYASEALYMAKIHPEKPSQELTKDEAVRLHSTIISVLEKGIRAKGASIRNYRRTEDNEGEMNLELHVYGQKGKQCPEPYCNDVVTSKILGGRSTFWCPSCQALPTNTNTNNKDKT